jgi:arylsulfatase A-like enzyme
LLPAPARLAAKLRLAICAALAVGLIEVAIVTVQQRVLGSLVFRNPHFVWMAPVGVSGLFVLVVAMWWLISRRSRRLAAPRVIVGLLVFLTALSLLSIPGWFHDVAVLLLAAGVTPHLTWLALRRRDRVQRAVKTALPALASIVVLLGAVATGMPVVSEMLALHRLPAAARGAPNILFIMLDTVRGGSLSLLGHRGRTTPQLEALGARGVVFERAIAPTPWTLPTHASVLTGHAPHELSANFNVPLDDTYPTLAEALARRGYATAGFVANQFNADYEHGISRGFAHWEDYPVTPGQVAYNTAVLRRFLLDGSQGRQNSRLLQALGLELRIGEKTAQRINADVLEWLERNDRRPTFAFLNYFDAHYPYAPPGSATSAAKPSSDRRWSIRSRFVRAMSRAPLRGRSADDEQALLEAYEGEIAWLDARIGELLREMESRGALDNTIVVVTSDHGEEFGEHGRYEHGNSVFMTQVHVPLIISYPQEVPRGERVSSPVSLQNIAATILDLVGATDSVTLPGQSLAALWTAPEYSALDHPLSLLEKESGVHASLVTPTLHYIWENGTERLYDYRRDPEELQDLSNAPWAPDTLQGLRRELIARLASDAPAALLALQVP